MSNPLARARAFRDDVVCTLHEHGVTAARRTGGRTDAADIVGLPWTLMTHRQQIAKFSDALVEAERRAKESGDDLWATVHHRRDHEIEQSYVVMPLQVFATVLSRLHPVG